MSDEQDEIRARYEAAMDCRNGVGYLFTGKKIFAALADIPRLQQEVERLKDDNSDLLRDLEDAQAGCIHCGGTGLVEIASEPVPCQCPDGVVLSLRVQLANAEAFRTAALAPMECGHAYGYCYHDECDDVMDEVRVCLVCERKRLCGQLAEKEKEVERLTALVDDDTTDEAIEPGMPRPVSDRSDGQASERLQLGPVRDAKVLCAAWRGKAPMTDQLQLFGRQKATCFVDPLCHHGWVMYGRAVKSCHLFTNGDIEELHRLAERIGLKRRYFQDKDVPHYDLTESKRVKAITAGAVELTRKEAVFMWREMRANGAG